MQGGGTGRWADSIQIILGLTVLIQIMQGGGWG